MSDIGCDFQNTSLIFVNKFPHLTTSLGPSKRTPPPNTSGDQLKGTGGNFMSRWGYTNNYTFTPPLMTTLQCQSNCLNVTNRLEGIIHTSIRHLSNNLINWFIVDRWLQTMSRSKLISFGELRGILINSNDLGSSR